MKHRLLVHLQAVLLALVLVLSASIAGAITWGEEDTGNLYPNVGTIIVISQDGTPLQWCSGTLIDSRIFLTAGHCVYSLQRYTDAGLLLGSFVSFAVDPSDTSTYLPIMEAILHPAYLTSPPSMRHWVDVGLLTFEEEVMGITPAIVAYEGFLDDLKAGRLLSPSTRILTVGYGSVLEFPPPEVVFPPPLRRYAFAEYRGLLKSWLLVSQNPALGNGGTGYGDSGGPAFWIDPVFGSLVLVGITSWGDPNLVSTTFFHRADIARTLDFIAEVTTALPPD